MTPDAALGLGGWFSVLDGDERLVALYERHYSCNPATSHEAHLQRGISGVGQSTCLLTWKGDAGFVWVRNLTERYDGQVGVQCSFFRNESKELSSGLIGGAEQWAWERWPGKRLWTYVSPTKIRSTNPGFCFLKAGWKRCGTSNGGLVILERLP